MKRIAVFFDGTDDNGHDRDRPATNVFKLFEAAKGLQACEYIPGIGTALPAGTPLRRWRTQYWRDSLDQAFGIGATARVKQAYGHIARHYKEGDQLFLFGFSRGAFMARMMAGFLDKVGLLFADVADAEYVAQAFQLYVRYDAGSRLHAFLRNMRNHAVMTGLDSVKTHFLGQWDTVESMARAGISAPAERRLVRIADRERDMALPEWIRNCSHAMAIHELRADFPLLSWSGKSFEKGQVLRQAWFAGAHADVGGGYAADVEPGTAHADISLRWMMCEAQDKGLMLDVLPAMPHGGPIVHVPPQPYFLFGAARVRPQIEGAPVADRWDYMHDSALRRFWLDLEAVSGDNASPQQPTLSEADSAAMRLHYNQCFPKNVLPQPVTPHHLRAADKALTDALEGRTRLGDTQLLHALALVVAFFDIQAGYNFSTCDAALQPRLQQAFSKVTAAMDPEFAHNFPINKRRAVALKRDLEIGHPEKDERKGPPDKI
jgi:Uncharacterized alpha/beta hydrolase domain (DUF2235)